MTVYLMLPPMIMGMGLVCATHLSEKTRKKLFLILSFSILVFLSAFRANSVGTDSMSYAQSFLKIGKAHDLRTIFALMDSAPVYAIYCKLVYMIFPTEQAYFIFNAIIICACMLFFFNTFSDNLPLSVYCFVTLWFYCTSFNTERQYVAMSLAMLAVCMVYKKKKIAALCLMLMAIGIHNTAAVFLPIVLLFMFEIHITRKRLIRIILIAIVSGIFLGLLFEPLIYLFTRIFPRYARYVNGLAIHSVHEQSRGDNIYLTLLFLAVLVLSTVIIWVNTKNGGQVSDKLSKMYIMGLIGVVLGIAMARNIALARVRAYFTLSMCCLIPQALRYSGNARVRVLYYFATYLILLVPYFICLSRNMSGVVPYQFFWEM